MKEDQEQLNFSRNILAKLVIIAKEVFNNYLVFNIDNVTLSAKEVTNYIQNSKLVFNDKVFKHLEYTVTEGSFNCKFDCRNIFELVEKFEKLAKIKQSEKTVFVVGNGIEKKISAKTYFIDGKSGKTVCRKRTLNQVTENLAIVSNKTEGIYFLRVNDIWYQFHVVQKTNECYEDIYKKFIEVEDLCNFVYKPLKNWNYPEGNKYNELFKILYEALSKVMIQDTTKDTKVVEDTVNSVPVTETATKIQNTTKDTKVVEDTVNSVPVTETATKIQDTTKDTKVVEDSVNSVPVTETAAKNQDPTKIAKVLLKPIVAISSFPSVMVHGTVSTGNVCSLSELKQTYLCKLPVMKLPELQLSG